MSLAWAMVADGVRSYNETPVYGAALNLSRREKGPFGAG